MAHRQETWICETCKRDACKGGCYYRPHRIKKLLARLPYSTAQVRDPNMYGIVRTKVEANGQEGNWAERADLLRALAHVNRATPNGPVIEQVLVLAYVGIPSPERRGKHVGCSDSAIGRLLGMDPATVAGYRQRGLRLMVACLNPDYDWDKEQQ